LTDDRAAFAVPSTGTLLKLKEPETGAGPEIPVSRPTPGEYHRWMRLRVSAPLLLLGVLAVQAGLSLRLVWANTAFNDEALYLWSGRWEIAHLLHGTAIPQFQRYFSGAPVIYPIIGAIADAHGGLAAARLLSMAFMLGTTVLLYTATGRLFGRRAAVCAAAVFGFLGPVQFLGSFATYDAMAIFLLALASTLVITGRGRWSEPLLILGGLVLALADATKYATTLWDPVVILLAGLTAAKGGWLRRSLRSLRLAVYTGGVVMAALLVAGRSYLAGILFTTLARQAGTVSSGGVLRDAAPWIGIVLLLAMRSVVVARGRRQVALCAVLAVAVLLAPLEQARIHTSISLEKHVAFGAWFGAIAAGYVLAHAVENSKYWKWRIPAATAAVVLLFGVLQARTFDARWPDSSQATAAMSRVVTGTRGPILAEEDEVFRYYLRLPPGRTYTLKGFYYWDVKARKELTGIPALQLAIRHHYFEDVELDYSFPDDLSYEKAITAAVHSTAGYRLIARIPWHDGSSSNYFQIWTYKPATTGGTTR
jgi:4-amino-4-deoxy-L-arabinose transferase-like glycosyltransferase